MTNTYIPPYAGKAFYSNWMFQKVFLKLQVILNLQSQWHLYITLGFDNNDIVGWNYMHFNEKLYHILNESCKTIWKNNWINWMLRSGRLVKTSTWGDSTKDCGKAEVEC